MRSGVIKVEESLVNRFNITESCSNAESRALVDIDLAIKRNYHMNIHLV